VSPSPFSAKSVRIEMEIVSTGSDRPSSLPFRSTKLVISGDHFVGPAGNGDAFKPDLFAGEETLLLGDMQIDR